MDKYTPLRGGRMLFDTEDNAEPLRKNQEREKITCVVLFLCRAKIHLTLDQDNKEETSFLLPCLLIESPSIWI